MKHVEAAAHDFICIFDQLGIPYALMGGLAVRAYGVPRPTYDVDVAILIADDQLPDLYDAVEAAGYTVPEAYRRGWLDKLADMPLVKFRIYRGTVEESVDVDLFIVSTDFQKQLIARRVPANVESLGQTWIVRPEELILLKLVAGRPRDLGDIDDVRFMVGELDADFMRHWGARLRILPALEELLATPPL